jgi:hypothetical protein
MGSMTTCHRLQKGPAPLNRQLDYPRPSPTDNQLRIRHLDLLHPALSSIQSLHPRQNTNHSTSIQQPHIPGFIFLLFTSSISQRTGLHNSPSQKNSQKHKQHTFLHCIHGGRIWSEMKNSKCFLQHNLFPVSTDFFFFSANWLRAEHT